jgi:hypothetical protein
LSSPTGCLAGGRVPFRGADKPSASPLIDEFETVSGLPPPERAEFTRRYGHVYGTGGPLTQMRFRLINRRNRRRRRREL